MSDVVLMPNFNRPEFLEVTLDLISKNNNFDSLFYLFVLDVGYRGQVVDVIRSFASKTGIKHKILKTPNKGYDLTKQSFNLLNGYKEAAKIADNFVFMIEDDIFVSNYFFDWHYVVNRDNPNIFCSIATRNNNSTIKTTPSWEKYYLIDGDYQSLGVCFKKEILNKILPFATEAYYRNPIQYCSNRFPHSKINGVHVEQDGLIRRVMELSRMPAAFSYHGLAYHAGFYGYHRGRKVTGPHDEKVRKIREICFNKDKMRKASKTEAFYQDSIPVELNLIWREPKLLEVYRDGKGINVD